MYLLLIAHNKCFVNQNVHYSAKMCCNLAILDMLILWMWRNGSEPTQNRGGLLILYVDSFKTHGLASSKKTCVPYNSMKLNINSFIMLNIILSQQRFYNFSQKLTCTCLFIRDYSEHWGWRLLWGIQILVSGHPDCANLPMGEVAHISPKTNFSKN